MGIAMTQRRRAAQTMGRPSPPPRQLRPQYRQFPWRRPLHLWWGTLAARTETTAAGISNLSMAAMEDTRTHGTSTVSIIHPARPAWDWRPQEFWGTVWCRREMHNTHSMVQCLGPWLELCWMAMPKNRNMDRGFQMKLYKTTKSLFYIDRFNREVD